ncbi:unnamed protein product [Lota lota]
MHNGNAKDLAPITGPVSIATPQADLTSSVELPGRAVRHMNVRSRSRATPPRIPSPEVCAVEGPGVEGPLPHTAPDVPGGISRRTRLMQSTHLAQQHQDPGPVTRGTSMDTQVHHNTKCGVIMRMVRPGFAVGLGAPSVCHRSLLVIAGRW